MIQEKSSNPASPTLSRLPSLDGWRALSIILVLGNHSTVASGFPFELTLPFKWIFDGDLGVRLFFQISGFLITWLMLVEHAQTGKVNLLHFYARRALRILPVYYAFLCVLIALQLFTPFRQSAGSWLGNLTFTTNFVGSGFISAHLWSLAVEEQFYVLWPGVFLLCGVAVRVQAVALVLAIPILAAPLFRVLTYLQCYPTFLRPLFSGYSFFNYFDSLAFGCACAVLLARKREALRAHLMSRPLRVALVAVTLVLIPHILCKLFLLGIFTVPLGNTCQAFGYSILLLQSIYAPQLRFYRFLNWRWACEVGVLSYSIYIWQQLFCANENAFHLTPVWWMSFPGWLVPALVVALASYYGLERPLFGLRSRFRKT